MLKEFRGIGGGFDRGEKRERERERGVAGRDREGDLEFLYLIHRRLVL